MKLFITGERFDGRQAVEYGLAHRAVPADELVSAVEQEIAAINLGGPNAVAEAKRLVRTVSELSVEEGFEATTEWSMRLFRSDEATEGMAAFREKRKPSWAEVEEQKGKGAA
jgi:methylglutaconyl-CoA hydratase